MLAARHGWEAEAVTAPALAVLANTLIWTGQFDLAEHWLDRARRATQADGEPGIRLLVNLTSAILLAARGHWDRALEEFAAARQMQALMVSEHGLTTRVIAWTIAAQVRLGMVGQARTTLAALDGRQASAGEVRTAAAVILLAEQDPAAARRELRLVLDGDAPVLSCLTRLEAYLLDSFACRDLGDERASREAAEQALNLAEPDRLILPFAMAGARPLLETLLRHGTSHGALAIDILDVTGGAGPGGPIQAAMMPVKELSRSELRVLRYLPTNLTRREIARELSVSPNTVDTHIRRIYAKFGATDRTAAVERGRELRLLSAGRT
jgi:LuxR family maltose regulon positive regulatory protein